MVSSGAEIQKTAVLGSGVMGAQIAAHMANAGFEVYLFDLPAKEGPKNSIVLKSLQFISKLEPAPLASKEKLNFIVPCNYEENLELLRHCDLIIEAISERLDWKNDLYKKVGPFLKDDVIFATNTSGLSINTLANTLEPKLKSRFCGVHFFNPPRYLPLVEIIPCQDTKTQVLDTLETFLTMQLGKSVIRAKDTPNFVANRVGVFSMVATVYHADKFNIPIEIVDALTGPAIGRPKSATYRTADVVGLDTLAHVVNTMDEHLKQDPWHHMYQLPPWVKSLIEKGQLGQKSGSGIYKKVGKEIQVWDSASSAYRPQQVAVDPQVESLLKEKSWSKKLEGLKNNTHPQAQFLWSIFRDVFHYCAFHLESIAFSARDIDFALRWGFGWNAGPLETWQMAGWTQVLGWINDDISQAKTTGKAPLPQWCSQLKTGVHLEGGGCYSPQANAYVGPSSLPVYKRHLAPEVFAGQTYVLGKTIFETDSVRLWFIKPEIPVLSFKSKMHAVGAGVLDGILKAVDWAEKNASGLVLWQTEPPFSAGANLSEVMQAISQKKYAEIEGMIARFQECSMRLKHSSIPTVAAVTGLALGGGCEFLMHCDRVVAHIETYTGLVEAGVGLLPGGGGCKEFAIRATALGAAHPAAMPSLQNAFTNMAMAKVSRSALDAKELGYLKPSDLVLFNSQHLLYVAMSQAKSMAKTGYRPPVISQNIPALGAPAEATFLMILANMKEGGFISDHDYEIGKRMAHILSGGGVTSGSLVSDQWLLKLERDLFMELIQMEKTQARIDYMLKNGKPLRN